MAVGIFVGAFAWRRTLDLALAKDLRIRRLEDDAFGVLVIHNLLDNSSLRHVLLPSAKVTMVNKFRSKSFPNKRSTELNTYLI